MVEPMSMATPWALRLEAGPDGGDHRLVVYSHGNVPRALAQRGLQTRQDDGVTDQVSQVPLPGQRVAEPLQVAARLEHVGRLHFDVVEPRSRIELDVAVLGILAHDLSVHLALRRHIDDEIAPDHRLAAQAMVVGKLAAALAVPLLDLVDRRQVRRAGIDRVLGKVPIHADDAAAAAQPAASAHRVHVHTDAAGSIQQPRAVAQTCRGARRA